VNQGTSTATQSGSLLVLTPQIVGGSDNLVLITQAAPATPWQATAKVGFRIKGSTNAQAGIAVYDGTKVIVFSVGIVNLVAKLAVNRYTNVSTFSSTPFSLTVASTNAFVPIGHWVYLAIKDDGTNLVYTLYVDGVQSFIALTESRTAFMAGAPTKVGLLAEFTSASEVGWGVFDWFRRTL
jgi:hypothetical protein